MNFAISGEKVARWLMGATAFPLLAPAVESVVTSKPLIVFGTYQPLSALAVAGYVATTVGLLVARLARDLRARRVSALMLGLLVVWLGNLALHFVYASASAFLFSQNYLFAFMGLSGFAWDGSSEIERGNRFAEHRTAHHCQSIGANKSRSRANSRNAHRWVLVVLGVFVAWEVLVNLGAFAEVVTLAMGLFGPRPPLYRTIVVCAISAVVAALALRQWRKRAIATDSDVLLATMLRGYGIFLLISCAYLFTTHW